MGTNGTTHRKLDCHSVIHIWKWLVTTIAQKEQLPKTSWGEKIQWRNELGKDWMRRYPFNRVVLNHPRYREVLQYLTWLNLSYPALQNELKACYTRR